MIEPAQELDVAIGQPPRQVAGAVHARRPGGAEGIGDEPLGRQLGRRQVAAPHPDAADVQLAGHADRHRLPSASSST